MDARGCKLNWPSFLEAWILARQRRSTKRGRNSTELSFQQQGNTRVVHADSVLEHRRRKKHMEQAQTTIMGGPDSVAFSDPVTPCWGPPFHFSGTYGKLSTVSQKSGAAFSRGFQNGTFAATWRSGCSKYRHEGGLYPLKDCNIGLLSETPISLFNASVFFYCGGG